MRAFWWNQLVDEDTLRAWIVSMGRRDSLRRVAHLMCELYVRARNVGLTDGGQVELPLTQTVIGDALGLTPVHVNRILRKLRQRGVMSLKGGCLVISDVDELVSVAGRGTGRLRTRRQDRLEDSRNSPEDSASRVFVSGDLGPNSSVVPQEAPCAAAAQPSLARSVERNASREAEPCNRRVNQVS